MTQFEDGPAKGQTLMLRRATRFLRVVEADGKFDGLDQLEDTPAANEKIYAYQITGHHCMCHIRADKGRSGFYQMCTFKLVENQPTDSEMRDNEAWAKWVHANKHLVENIC